jgi:tetratricopeptide (TPR) repeat protein
VTACFAWARAAVPIALLVGSGSATGDAAGQAREAACAGAEPGLRLVAEALDGGRWVEAEQHLLPLAASHADCSEVALGLARLREARGDAAEAEKLFERAASLAPHNARGHALFAQYWLSRGQAARADYLSARALSLDPDCPEGLVVQGRILGARGRTQEALQALSTAIRLEPTNAEAHYQLGILFYRRLLHLEAVRELEKVVALRPTDARAHDYLALTFEALGQPERAELAYRSALKVNEGPFLAGFLDYNYGRFLLKERRLGESRSYLDRAVARHPLSRAVRYERGKLNLALGEYAAAREDAERAQSLRDPGGPVLDLQVYYLLATVYRRLGEEDLARKYAELARTTPIPGQGRGR